MVPLHVRNQFAKHGLLLVTEMKRVLHRTGWSVADQGIVSLGMFFSNIILARYLPPSEYGVYVLLLTVSFSTTLFINYFLMYPLGLRLATVQSNERAQLISGAIGVAATFCVALSACLAVGVFCFGRFELVLPAVSAFLFWQLQLVTRSVFLVDLRQREAMVGDVVSSLGFVLVLVANRDALSLASALYYMAAMYMLGVIIQTVQLRFSLRALCTPYRWLIDHAPLSLVLPPFIAGGMWTLRVYCLVWVLAAFGGAVAVASLQAALTIFNALNPLLYALINPVFSTTARTFDGINRKAAWRAVRPYMLVVLAPVVLYLSAALLFPRFLLLVFYGQDSPFLQVGHLFPYLALFTATALPAELLAAFFLGMRETGLVLRSQSLSTNWPDFFDSANICDTWSPRGRVCGSSDQRSHPPHTSIIVLAFIIDL